MLESWVNRAQNAISKTFGKEATPYVLASIAVGGVALIAIPLLSPKQKSKGNAPPMIPYVIPFVGSLLDFGLRPIDFLIESYSKYGDCFSFVMFGRNMTYVMGPDGNNFFFNAKLADVSAEDAYASLTIPVFGKEVVYDVENSILMEQKRMVKDALTTNAFKLYIPMFVEETMDYVKRWKTEGSIDVFIAMSELTIMTASRTLMGKEIRSKLDESVAALYHDLDGGFQPINFLFEWLPLPQYYARDAAQRKLNGIFKDIVVARRAKPETTNSDVLQAIMDSTYKTGEKMSDNAIANFMIAILMAGQHTSSTTTTWTLLYIASDPQLQKALLEEQSRVLTGKPDTPASQLPPLTYDHIKNLNLLEMTIKETLRLRPPIFQIMRTVLRDVEYKGYIIPKGHTICSSPAVSQLDPEKYPDPLKFDPTRHLEAAPSGEWKLTNFDIAEKSARSHYLPFGAGRHRCIGEGFAYMQIKSIISMLIRTYELELPLNPDGTRKFPKQDFTSLIVMPEKPTMLLYKKRTA
ncbi:hypothetical protein SmJEL517_g02250 [Synchytrium microbalum]|uniref:Sterol 14-demethylase n=1 Tax=Synchytrium microbalum TaxID=1806994 RepID=A0A507CB69_9FUNG|nr:uncharacterized protein SmJEL517_g02250 [Synchytrium microbalum]TPX35246.1 hypothetical protein SmJEL517_g02250 [Synchytrium microbalum]